MDIENEHCYITPRGALYKLIGSCVAVIIAVHSAAINGVRYMHENVNIASHDVRRHTRVPSQRIPIMHFSIRFQAFMSKFVTLMCSLAFNVNNSKFLNVNDNGYRHGNPNSVLISFYLPFLAFAQQVTTANCNSIKITKIDA